MIILRKTLGVLLIIGVLFPMLLFLNPFMWGMRRPPYYIPSERLEKVLEGMEKEMFYKDIFQLAKQRVETFASVMPKTQVTMIEKLN